jgi:Spherulation-specific family 4
VSGRRPHLAVPAYFHPARDAATWALLTRRAAEVGLVVVNPSSGVGAATDPAYLGIGAGPWRSTVVGYVDTAYARRALDDVADEAAAYARRYGVGSVFLDQVTSGPLDLPHYRELARRLRAAGAQRVVLNPGTVPHPGYLEIADVVVTFEDTAQRYRQWRPAAAPVGLAATCHLVHGAPVATHRDVLVKAARLGAGYAFVTDRTLPNPWDGLPGGWAATAEGGHAS